jgi:hypothetical protein
MRKRILRFATLCLLAQLAVVPAYAQAFVYRAKVPFSFVVLGKTVPAGEYQLIAAPHMVKIEDSDGVPITTALANEIAGRFVGATGQLIFHCYGDHCFLSELRAPLPGDSRELLTSRSEAEWAKKEQGKYFVVLGEKPSRNHNPQSSK